MLQTSESVWMSRTEGERIGRNNSPLGWCLKIYVGERNVRGTITPHFSSNTFCSALSWGVIRSLSFAFILKNCHLLFYLRNLVTWKMFRRVIFKFHTNLLPSVSFLFNSLNMVNTTLFCFLVFSCHPICFHIISFSWKLPNIVDWFLKCFCFWVCTTPPDTTNYYCLWFDMKSFFFFGCYKVMFANSSEKGFSLNSTLF